MWVNYPIRITGKLSLTPAQAKKIFGYTMKEGAKGVALQRRGSRIFIRSLMPQRKPNTEMQQIAERKLTIISKIGSRHMEDLIYPVWEPIARKTKRYPSGFTMFVGINMRRIKCRGRPKCLPSCSHKSGS